MHFPIEPAQKNLNFLLQSLIERLDTANLKLSRPIFATEASLDRLGQQDNSCVHTMSVSDYCNGLNQLVGGISNEYIHFPRCKLLAISPMPEEDSFDFLKFHCENCEEKSKPCIFPIGSGQELVKIEAFTDFKLYFCMACGAKLSQVYTMVFTVSDAPIILSDRAERAEIEEEKKQGEAPQVDIVLFSAHGKGSKFFRDIEPWKDLVEE